MTDAAVAAFGRIDILVSNAALRRQTPFTEMSFAEWREILSVALDGAFICARPCVQHMVAAGGGALVTTGGISTTVGTQNRHQVCSAQAGLAGHTHALSVELTAHRIHVK